MEKEQMKLLFRLIIIIAVFIITVVLIKTWYDYPKDFECYEYDNICHKYNIEQFDDCIPLGHESVGFLTSEDFWLCDGVKVAKDCIEGEFIKRRIQFQPNMLDVLSLDCHELKEKGEE